MGVADQDSAPPTNRAQIGETPITTAKGLGIFHDAAAAGNIHHTKIPDEDLISLVSIMQDNKFTTAAELEEYLLSPVGRNTFFPPNLYTPDEVPTQAKGLATELLLFIEKSNKGS